MLEEASPRDRIWGIGMGSKHIDVYDQSKWRGTNLLGIELMKVRNYIKRIDAKKEKDKKKKAKTNKDIKVKK